MSLAVRSFHEQFQRNLLEDIKSECSGSFEKACLSLFKSQHDVDARSLWEAMDGLGTNEDRLDEVILFRSGVELRGVQAAYMSIYETDLIEDLEDEVGGHALAMYITALTEKVPHNEYETENDVKYLYEAGEGRVGTDEETFARVLGMSEPAHIEAMRELYQRTHGKTFEEVIKSEFDSILDESALKRCMLNISMGYGNYIGKRLHKAMKGIGTDDGMLMRLLFSHRESGALAGASAYLQAQTGKTLIQWLRSECSGDYKKLMVAVAKAHGCDA